MTEAGALPLYVQIAELLIREIQSGRLSDGARLPPERQMAADLAISVGTLRKALADLEGRGLLERRQGSGNYVCRPDSAAGVYAFFRLELTQGGGLPTAEVLSVGRHDKPDDFPAFGQSGQGHRIRRLRRLSGAPVALEEIWLDGAEADSLNADDLSESLYLFYKTQLGLWISRVEDRIGVGHVPPWSVDSFDPASGDVCGYIERLSWAGDGRAVEYSRTWFDSDRARYASRLG